MLIRKAPSEVWCSILRVCQQLNHETSFISERLKLSCPLFLRSDLADDLRLW